MKKSPKALTLEDGHTNILALLSSTPKEEKSPLVCTKTEEVTA